MYIDAKKLKIFMARKCLSMKGLSEVSGVTPLTISKAINGRNARTDTVGLLAQALGVDPSEIIKEEQ